MFAVVGRSHDLAWSVLDRHSRSKRDINVQYQGELGFDLDLSCDHLR